ncbi:MAG TPA: phosphatase PAP2 family protein [Acidimicrobiales bacterium]|nr:phosphatase PAP2 family protein [Acidimicrobiales bacterium]
MDASWYRDVNRFAVHTSWLHPFMRDDALYGVGLYAILVVAAWWYARFGHPATRAVAATVWTAVGTVAAVGVNQLIARAVQRPRPFLKIPGAEVLVAKSHDFSFPSDHAVTAGAATAGLWVASYYGPRIIRRLAITSSVLAVLLAFARVYVGVHYPGDVIVGLGVGAAVVLVGWLALGSLLTRGADVIARSGPLRPLVVAGPRA